MGSLRGPGGGQNVAFAAVEVPCALVNVTVSELIAFATFCTAKGMVSVNWLPNWTEAGSWYQVGKTPVSGMLKSLDVSFVPAAGIRWTVAPVTSRVVE